MSVSHTFTFGHSGGSVSLADSVSVTGGALAYDGSFTVAGSTTDQQVGVAVTMAACLGVYIKTDQDLTLETNATDHAGGDSFTLKAGIPFVWLKNSGITCPFTADVTTMYFTNAGSTAATVYLRVIKS